MRKLNLKNEVRRENPRNCATDKKRMTLQSSFAMLLTCYWLALILLRRNHPK